MRTKNNGPAPFAAAQVTFFRELAAIEVAHQRARETARRNLTDPAAVELVAGLVAGLEKTAADAARARYYGRLETLKNVYQLGPANADF